MDWFLSRLALPKDSGLFWISLFLLMTVTSPVGGAKVWKQKQVGEILMRNALLRSNSLAWWRPGDSVLDEEKKKVQTHDKLNIGPSELPSSESVTPSHLWPTRETNNRCMFRPVWTVRGNRKIINKKVPAFKIKKHGMMNGVVTAKRSGFRSILSCAVCGHKTTDVFSGSRRGRRTLCSHTPNQYLFFLCHFVVPGPWEIDTASTAPQNPFMLVRGKKKTAGSACPRFWIGIYMQSSAHSLEMTIQNE